VQFSVNFPRLLDRLGHFHAQQLPVSLPELM
jgi:hypothetical protein